MGGDSNDKDERPRSFTMVMADFLRLNVVSDHTE